MSVLHDAKGDSTLPTGTVVRTVWFKNMESLEGP